MALVWGDITKQKFTSVYLNLLYNGMFLEKRPIIFFIFCDGALLTCLGSRKDTLISTCCRKQVWEKCALSYGYDWHHTRKVKTAQTCLKKKEGEAGVPVMTCQIFAKEHLFLTYALARTRAQFPAFCSRDQWVTHFLIKEPLIIHDCTRWSLTGTSCETWQWWSVD